jgi:uncharacterized membrane protein YdcZ (DUF606 family)
MRLDFLAALSGVMIALQARANGELSHRLNNGLEAALVSFGSGLVIIAVISIFHKGTSGTDHWRSNLFSGIYCRPNCDVALR